MRKKKTICIFDVRGLLYKLDLNEKRKEREDGFEFRETKNEENGKSDAINPFNLKNVFIFSR